ncbi:MAG: hypothetical protein JOY71_03990 [Acetobacteraceae bacterium]|nr:hypothetical protein [Acetobacteraceae bacterium]
MSPETYWLVVPLVGIALSGFGWLALWLTRPRGETTGSGGPGMVRGDFYPGMTPDEAHREQQRQQQMLQAQRLSKKHGS